MVLLKFPEAQPQVPWAAPALHPLSSPIPDLGAHVAPWGLQTRLWVGSGPSLSSQSNLASALAGPTLPWGSLG